MNYLERNLDDYNVPIFIQKDLLHLWEKTTIDLVGWAAFQRLTLKRDLSDVNETS